MASFKLQGNARGLFTPDAACSSPGLPVASFKLQGNARGLFTPDAACSSPGLPVASFKEAGKRVERAPVVERVALLRACS